MDKKKINLYQQWINMKKPYHLILISLFFSLAVSAQTVKENEISFKAKFSTIPSSVQKYMKRFTWHTGCPIAIGELRYVHLSYWGFDNKAHQGVLIVNKALAKEVVSIFKILYLNKFPIARMEPMEVFKGNDNAALAANNTSAFNCREVTGQPGIFSQHSYGRAIDINGKINPYVKGNLVLPANGALFINRNKPYPGKITKNSLIYKVFTQHGWDWGGNWYDVQDYQHFEKRAKGKKRNPFGYR